MKIRYNQVNNFLVLAAPTVDNTRIVVLIIFDGLFHSSQGKFLFFVVAISTHLNSDRPNEARIQNLKRFILVVNQLALLDELRKSKRGTGFSTTNHSPIEKQSWMGDGSLIVEGTFHSLDKLYLTVVGFNVKSWEKFIICCVIHQFGVSYYHTFVCVVVVILKTFYAEFEIENQSWRHFYFFAVV